MTTVGPSSRCWLIVCPSSTSNVRHSLLVPPHPVSTSLFMNLRWLAMCLLWVYFTALQVDVGMQMSEATCCVPMQATSERVMQMPGHVCCTSRWCPELLGLSALVPV